MPEDARKDHAGNDKEDGHEEVVRWAQSEVAQSDAPRIRVAIDVRICLHITLRRLTYTLDVTNGSLGNQRRREETLQFGLDEDAFFRLGFVLLLQARRVHVRRINAAHLDVVSLQLDAQSIRQTLDRVLARCIGSIPDVAEHAARAANEINLSLQVKPQYDLYSIALNHARHGIEKSVHRAHVIHLNGLLVVLDRLSKGIPV